MKRAVFFDRDGVLCPLVPLPGNPHASARCRDDFKIFPHVKSALECLPDDYLTFVVTNQPGIIDGFLNINDLLWMHRKLGTYGFSEIVTCCDRNHPDYKPGSGMVTKMLAKYNVDPTESYLVGDRWKDIVCGFNAGLTTILVGDKYDDGGSGIHPDKIVPDVHHACHWIAKRNHHEKPRTDRY